MNLKFCLSLLLLTILELSKAQTQPLINPYNRQALSLNGPWHYIVDPYENGYYNYRYEAFDKSENPSKNAYFMNSQKQGKSDLLEYDFDGMPTMNIPTDWNTADDQLFYYEGTVWFKKSFELKTTENDLHHFLYFGAVNYKAEVYLNGQKLGTHIGGFTPFHYEVTELLKEKNFVVVKVDNKRLKEAVPTLNTDWWNYGGITRDVKLISTPETYISDYQFKLNDVQKIEASIMLSGSQKSDQTIAIQIEELDIDISIKGDKEGIAHLVIDPNELELWTPDSPKLYSVKIHTLDDTLVDQIGFKTIATRGSEILLNGTPVFLKGISIHEEKLGGGRIQSKADARQLLEWAKELGCNYVRLAHYPHNEHMVRLADEMGIMVWEEIPVYWTIDWTNEQTYLNAENQLKEMIFRDKNRSSVIIWSMANETPVREERNLFLKELAQTARALDDTRLISAALEQSRLDNDPNTRIIHDPFANEVDVLSFNQYIGWYEGLPDFARKINWQIDIDKPVLISEFGAGAKFGFHADERTRFSEEYQADLYKETIDMLTRIPQLSGFSPWILMDFRSPRRVLPKIQDNWNRKGLLSEKGEKKMAFFVLQDFYKNK